MKRIALFLLILISIMCEAREVYAFNDTLTHPNLTDKALKQSQTALNSYFENILMFKDGIDEQVLHKNLIQWLQYGAEMEDTPKCRASNHFHDPYLFWTESGLTDTTTFLNLCWLQSYPLEDITSNVTWATGYVSKDALGPTTSITEKNIWDWESARNYFYTYLTGLDAETNAVIAPDEFWRLMNLTRTFQALGQTMHLLQDAAVPAHVRNDFS